MLLGAAPSISDIIDIFIGAWSGLAEGGGTAIQAGFNSIFMSPEGTMSFAGTMIILFAGISIGLGFLSWVMRKVR